MPPQVIALILFILQEIIKQQPALAAAFKDIFATANPTDVDWAVLRAKVASKCYADYVPDSALPDAPAAAPVLTLTPAPETPSAAPPPPPPASLTGTTPQTAAAVFTGQAVDPHL